jgi:hypothetical protein
VGEEKGAVGPGRRGPGPAQGEEAEFIGAMHIGEDGFPVLKVIEADQGLPVHEVGEEVFVAVVGGDARRGR